MAECEVGGCKNYAARELCHPHQVQVRNGRLAAKAHWYTQVNPPCVLEGCERPSRAKKPGQPCHVHETYLKEGRDINTVRPKRLRHEPAARCSEGDCRREAKSKGLCHKHYGQLKYDPAPRFNCLAEGCLKQFPAPARRCKKHQKQWQDWGITWNGQRPTQEIREIRISRRPQCSVPGCDAKCSSDLSMLCRTHEVDRKRKSLDTETFVMLKSVTECQACGDSGVKLVMDHDHAHPHPRDGMCEVCIRGMLCGYCNTALGYLKDSKERAFKLVAYLERTTKISHG